MKQFLNLIRVNIEDIQESFGGSSALVRGLVAAAGLLPAAGFALLLREFDRRIGDHGLVQGAAWMLRQFYRGVDARGPAAPSDGGLLLVANHPGLGDSVALLSRLSGREPVIVTHDRAFFRALPHLLRHLIVVPERAERRLATIKAMGEALRQGRTVLLYPAGAIEPDPAVHTGNPSPLLTWSPVVGHLVRAARRGGFRFWVQPAMTAGVFPARAFQSPLVRHENDQAKRERRAASQMVAFRSSRGQSIRLQFGLPFSSADPAFEGMDSAPATELVVHRALGTLAEMARETPTPETRPSFNRRPMPA